MISDDESGYDSNSYDLDRGTTGGEDNFEGDTDEVFQTSVQTSAHLQASFEVIYDSPPPFNALDRFVQSKRNPGYTIKKSEDAKTSLVLETKTESGEVKRRALLNPDRFKTQMCKAYLRGSCLFADQCQFAHGESDLRAPKVHQKYKTQKCKHFAAGKCKHGNACWFIHENDVKEKQLTDVMKILSKKSEKEIEQWASNTE